MLKTFILAQNVVASVRDDEFVQKLEDVCLHVVDLLLVVCVSNSAFISVHFLLQIRSPLGFGSGSFDKKK